MPEAIPKTEQRVQLHTAGCINEKIQRETEARILFYSQRLKDIEQRLNELECEWDIERVLETQASNLILLGLLFGTAINRKWYILSAGVAGFFLQHALLGWCPPVPILRRLGVRTTSEINHERYALKAIRGDFDEVNSKSDASVQVKAEKAINAAKIR